MYIYSSRRDDAFSEDVVEGAPRPEPGVLDGLRREEPEAEEPEEAAQPSRTRRRRGRARGRRR